MADPDWIKEADEKLEKKRKEIEEDPTLLDDYDTPNWREKTQGYGPLDPV